MTEYLAHVSVIPLQTKGNVRSISQKERDLSAYSPALPQHRLSGDTALLPHSFHPGDELVTDLFAERRGTRKDIIDACHRVRLDERVFSEGDDDGRHEVLKKMVSGRGQSSITDQTT